MKFLSKELIDEMLKQAEADPELPSKLKGLTIRLLMVGTDCPGNEDRQYSIILADGNLISMEMETQPAPSDLRTAPLDKTKYDSRVICSYETLLDLVQEKMSMVAALGKVTIDGDLPKLMTQVEGFIALLQFMNTLPLEY
ncbi:MAG: hypothetical protein E3J24_00935 [Dehalococcoidia bacterium]|nr:MAG: hypothetical protein E3J24_00935 [Dehalococcoidia bacterium]